MQATGGANTTIAIVATDAPLTKVQCHRLAVTAHDGLARAIVPSHTPLDGDLVFGVATGSDGSVRYNRLSQHRGGGCGLPQPRHRARSLCGDGGAGGYPAHLSPRLTGPPRQAKFLISL